MSTLALGIWDLSLLWLATMAGLTLAAVGLVLLALACWGDYPEERS